MGCLFSATGTLYKTTNRITLNRFGFVDLTSDSISKENYPSIYNSYYTRYAGKSQSKESKIDLVILEGAKGSVKGLVKEMQTKDYTFFDPPPAGGFFSNQKY